MEYQSLSKNSRLSDPQKARLKLANIVTIADLMLMAPSDVGKKCRVPLSEAQAMIDLVCAEHPLQPLSLNDSRMRADEVFTTGDPILDETLGGGMKTGMLWEIVGESAAGKTQLSLQLSLCVQLPPKLGGVSGSACFLSTSWTLPTQRILEIADAHPLLSPAVCGLSDIHTLKIPTIPALLHVLSQVLPTFLQERTSRPGSKPVKLLIIDALTELFHTDNKTSSNTLSQRSKDLAEISTLIHMLASKHQIAVLVLNEVSDAFDRAPNADLGQPGEILYRDQARLFSRADSIPGENRKEAALGLVWANQVNARIMLTRTGRMRYFDDMKTRPAKRRKLDGDAGINSRIASSLSEDEPIRVRRLSVLFSSVCPPSSLDYIVTEQGITIIPEEPAPPPSLAPINRSSHVDIPLVEHPTLPQPPSSSGERLPALDTVQDSDDVLHVPSEGIDSEDGPQGEVEADEWEAYWKEADKDDDMYNNLDIDALSSSLPVIPSTFPKE